MKILTVIALPSTISDLDRLRDTFNNLDVEFVFLDDSRDYNIPVKTEWKFYIYCDEWFSNSLKEIFPFYLEHGKKFDYISVYKMIKEKVDISPRLFKANIRIRDDCVYPINPDLEHTAILDGFLFGESYD